MQQTVEMFGLCRVTVNPDLKIQKIEAFFDPETFLRALEGDEAKLQGCNSIDIFVSPESGLKPGPSHVWSVDTCLSLNVAENVSQFHAQFCAQSS